jgi:hypothetical protein
VGAVEKGVQDRLLEVGEDAHGEPTDGTAQATRAP